MTGSCLAPYPRYFDEDNPSCDAEALLQPMVKEIYYVFF